MSDLTLEDDEPTVQKSSDEQPASAAQKPQADAKHKAKTPNAFTPIIYRGSVGEIVKLVLGNVLLNIPTLGIYSFWGKTRLRKYVASSMSVAQDSLEYLGTGKELFFGFLKALPILVILFAAYTYFSIGKSPLIIIPALVFVYLIQVAIFAATRYRFSRTSWRGIRGYVEGSAFSYANVAMWRMFLNIITLYILKPSSDIKLHKHIMDRSYFGSVMANFDPSAGKGLMGTHLLTLLLFIPTLGLSRLWYAAALKRAKMAGLTIDDIGFQSTVTGGGIFGLLAKNMLTAMAVLTIPAILALILFGGLTGMILSQAGEEVNPMTAMSAVMNGPSGLIGGIGVMILYFIGLQLAKAINVNRGIRFACNHILLKGDLETSNVAQAENQKMPIGEGLDDALGLDTGLI